MFTYAYYTVIANCTRTYALWIALNHNWVHVVTTVPLPRCWQVKWWSPIVWIDVLLQICGKTTAPCLLLKEWYRRCSWPLATSSTEKSIWFCDVLWLVLYVTDRLSIYSRRKHKKHPKDTKMWGIWDQIIPNEGVDSVNLTISAWCFILFI